MFKKVYISGPLMAAKDLDSVKRLYNYIASICSEHSFSPYLPHKNTDPIIDSNISDCDVYEKDCIEMTSSSLVISYIGEPSLGVGAELSICISKNIPLITINQSGQKISRFLKGMLNTSKNVQSIEYHNIDDLRTELVDCLKSLQLEIEHA
jgi:nucleoside 2-deoxyribosyltransferase